RYMRARRSSHFASFISVASMTGIAIGVAALIIVISVMNGFGNDLRERLVSLTAHATITGSDGVLGDWQVAIDVATASDRVIGAAPYVEGQGMLVNGANLSGVAIQGVNPQLEPQVSSIGQSLYTGTLDSLQAGQNRILLGGYLAQRLGADIGSKINILVPQPTGDGTGVLPFLHRFTVAGLFSGNVPDQALTIAYIHIADAAAMFEMGEQVSGVRLKLDDMFAAPVVATELAAQLGSAFAVTDWSVQQRIFFRAIKIEKIMVFCILLLVIAVAAFNIIMTQVMLVNEKRIDVAILRTMGVAPRSVLGIFLLQGNLIGLLGVTVGVIAGVLVGANTAAITAAIERSLGFDFIDSSVFYLTQIPSDVRWHEVVFIAIIGLLLAGLSTVYPAWRASRTQPADALRYE
ncbi:MAG: lipoprotein-releasing ABC transporter permease subunit, partial [Gammaproteobacteria bacterium]|nr:lipoprotein-releasing ABC transporter permease subunit [Gammaproteobacteria bacterium]